jgi:protein SCO1/2
MHKKSAITIILVSLGLGIAIVLFYPQSAMHQTGQIEASQVSEPPKGALKTPVPLKPFKLKQDDLTPFDLDDLKGKWSFVFFGYTHCPDVCPTTLTEMAQAHEILANTPGILRNTQFVFVSIDPERDTPEMLADYVAYFNPDFVGATGTPTELKKLTKQLDIKFNKGDITESGYAMNHSSAALLIDPQGRYYARFSAPHYSEVISRQYLAIHRFYENTQANKPSQETQ